MHSVVVVYLEKHALSCGRPVYHARNRVFNLLVTSANCYPSCFGLQKCRLIARIRFCEVYGAGG